MFIKRLVWWSYPLSFTNPPNNPCLPIRTRSRSSILQKNREYVCCLTLIARTGRILAYLEFFLPMLYLNNWSHTPPRIIFLHTQCKDLWRGGDWNCHSNIEQVSPVGRPLTAAILYSLSVTFLLDRAKVYARPKINKMTLGKQYS